MALDPRIRKTIHEALLLLRPKEKLDPWQWSTRYLHIANGESRYPGLFSTALAPYQKKVLVTAGDPKIHRITMQWGSQLGKSQTLLALAMYYVHWVVASVGYYSASATILDEFSKDRIQPTVDASPALRPLLKSSTAKKSGNSIRYKRFKNGSILRLRNANVAASFRGPSMRLVLADEVDAIQMDVQGEGDALVQLQSRGTVWGDLFKFVLASTPTITDASLVEASFKESDQRHYYVPCPHCQHMQILRMSTYSEAEDKQVYWFKIPQDGEPYFECQGCHEPILERSKGWMLANGEWRSHNPAVKDHAGFHLSTFYSPLFGWDRMASEWTAAVRKGNLAKKAYINTRLAETWNDYETARLTSHALEEKREYYSDFIPKDVAYLTSFTDVQKDRLECSVYGHGLEDHLYLIRHYIIYGITTTAYTPAFAALDKLLGSEFQHESGHLMKITCSFVDCSEGDRAATVADFCNARLKRAVFASKGSSVDVKGATKRSTDKKGLTIILMDSNQLKHSLVPRLVVKDKTLPGTIHLPADRICYILSENGDLQEYFNQDGTSYDSLFLDQFLSEYVGPKGRWTKKPGVRRNEALDGLIGAAAAWGYAKRERWSGVNVRARLAELNGPAQQDAPQLKIQPKETSEPMPGSRDEVIRTIEAPKPPPPPAPRAKRLDINELLDDLG